MLLNSDVCPLRNDLVNQGTSNGRQQSSFFMTSGLSTNPVNAPASSARGSMPSLSMLSLSSRAAAHRSSLLRLSATQTSELELNVDILKDLFWTLFSKLDAVLQGFRVAHEVASRIVEVRRSNASDLKAERDLT